MTDVSVREEEPSQMSRFFNTTGPCNPERHYMLPAHERLVGGNLARYVKNELYWVLHAPRQTGKTTFLQSWMRQINGGGEGVACYVSVEIKLVHPQDSLETTIEEGLKQTARYRDTVGAKEAWLIVFDRRDKSRSLPWEQRLSTRSTDQINVVTC